MTPSETARAALARRWRRSERSQTAWWRIRTLAFIAIAVTLPSPHGRERAVERMLGMTVREVMQLKRCMPRVAWSWVRKWCAMCPASDTLGSRVSRESMNRATRRTCGYGLGALLRASW